MARPNWLFALTSIGMVFLVTANIMAEDWPQWRGINRDGESVETGLLKTWPSGGLKLIWRTGNLGEGYTGVSIVGNRLYAMSGENNLRIDGTTPAMSMSECDG